MPSNAEMILMHLMDYLKESCQWGTLRWDGVLAYCIGYYDSITMDHVVAIRQLEKYGAIKGEEI